MSSAVQVADKLSISDNCTHRELIVALHMVCEILACDERVQVSGVCAVVDARRVLSTSNALWTNTIRLLCDTMQDALPMRMKGIHVIHDSCCAPMHFALIAPIMLDSKWKQRVRFNPTFTYMRYTF
jgi:hypothetical protein